jgi:hypothetical protein
MSGPPPHPWSRVGNTGNTGNTDNAAAWLHRLEANNQSAHGAVDGEEVINIPSQCFRGRSGGTGSVFSGMLNLRTGRMRFDCANDLAFWMEIDLFSAPGLAHAPGGAGADAAQQEFEAAAEPTEPEERA